MDDARVVFEDTAILLLDKPHGLACQASKGETIQTKYSEYHFITRIDQPASGLVLMAKSEAAAMILTKNLSQNAIDKKYLCLVEGHLTEPNGTAIDLLIKNGQKAYVDDKGKPCRIEWKTAKQLDKYTFLDVVIDQGRFHQIRCQLATAGHSIKGDLKYGSRRSNKEGGIYLCCTEISFEHPYTGEVMDFKIAPPSGHLPLWALSQD